MTLSIIRMSKIVNQNEQNKPTHPLALLLTAPFRFVGSLTFGIILLAVLLVLLAWGTFVESEYGAAVAQFVLYANTWFYFLVGLLALNVFFNMLVRFPWGQHGIPFLVTHVGILILIFGCYLTWRCGVEAQITLPEGTIGRVAVKLDKQKFELQPIIHTAGVTPEPIHLPFRSGPFSWQDYEYNNWMQDGRRYKRILWHAMQFGHRDKGELKTGNPNVKIEVLDFYASSALEPVPAFDVNVLWSKMVTTESDVGETRETPRIWELVRLDLRQQHRTIAGLFEVRGASTTMSQRERVTYNLALSPEELTAFQTSRPKGGTNAGLWGEIVLFYGGKHYHVNVDQILELADNSRFLVEGSGLQIGNVMFRDRGPIINFTVYTPSGEQETMTLFPDNPELNVQARRLGIFGSYWVDPLRVMQESRSHAGNPMLERLAVQRLDFLQGTDKKLYYRLWSGQKIVADGVVPGEGPKRPPFKLAEQTPDEVEIAIDRFVPQDVPGGRVVSTSTGRRQHGEQRVKLHVVFNGNEDTFWLRATTPTVVPLPPEPDQVRYVYGNNQSLGVQWNYENIDLGFGILLKKFDKRTEPGTRMPSHFSSLVDFVEPVDSAETGKTFSWNYRGYRALRGGEDVLISINRPGFFGAGKGPWYRIYQSSYRGPFHPDQHEFYEFYDGTIFPWETRPRETIAMSTLSVNADPGRGWKYFGSLLIVLGAALFVWRKHS